MLRWSILFLFISLLAGALGFSEAVTEISSYGRILFFVFLTLFVITFLLGTVTKDSDFNQEHEKSE